MTHGRQAGHLIILLSNNSHTWVLIHIGAHANIHMGQVTKPRLSRYPTLPSTDSKTRQQDSHCSSTRPTYSCADIHLHTHVRAYIYLNTYTHYPLYLVYLFWPNKSPWKQSISITYITIIDTTYTHIFRCNFFFYSNCETLERGVIYSFQQFCAHLLFYVICVVCSSVFVVF